MMCWARVDLPAISGPKISVMRPRGMPPTPRAISRAREPVGIVSTAALAAAAPRRMMEPRPNCFSIWPMASSRACWRSCLPSPRSVTIAPVCLGRRHNSTGGRCQQGLCDTSVRLGEESGDEIGDEAEEDDGHHRRKVEHAQAGQELADGGEDGLRDIGQED